MTWKFSQLPFEIMDHIFTWSRLIYTHQARANPSFPHLGRRTQHDFFNYVLVSKAWMESALRVLYMDVNLATFAKVQTFSMTMSLKRERWNMVRSLCVYDLGCVYRQGSAQIDQSPGVWNYLLLAALLLVPGETNPRLDPPSSHQDSAGGRLSKILRALRLYRSKSRPKLDPGVPNFLYGLQPMNTSIPAQGSWSRLTTLQVRPRANHQMVQVLDAIGAISQLESLALAWETEPREYYEQYTMRFPRSQRLRLLRLRHFSWNAEPLHWGAARLINMAHLMASWEFTPSCCIELAGIATHGAAIGELVPFFERHLYGTWSIISMRKEQRCLDCALRYICGHLTCHLSFLASCIADNEDPLQLVARLPPMLTLLYGRTTFWDLSTVLQCLLRRTRLSPGTALCVELEGIEVPQDVHSELQQHVQTLWNKNIELVVHQ